jgi:hypothetical protein
MTDDKDDTVENGLGISPKRVDYIKDVVIATFAIADTISGSIKSLARRFEDPVERDYAVYSLGMMIEKMSGLRHTFVRADPRAMLSELPPEIQAIIKDAQSKATEFINSERPKKKEGAPYD